MRRAVPFVVIAAFLVAGCATEPRTKTIEIITEPPGAKILVNEDYIGESPCTITVPASKTGFFTHYTTIEAMPISAGQRPQLKTFAGGVSTSYDDPIPSRIYFNMNIVTRPINIDLSVK